VGHHLAAGDRRLGANDSRPRAAGGRPLAGLEFVEELLTMDLTCTDKMGRNAVTSRHGSCLRRPRWPGPGDAESDSTAGGASASQTASGTANAAVGKHVIVGYEKVPSPCDRLIRYRQTSRFSALFLVVAFLVAGSPTPPSATGSIPT
jgi:hypothetical protein